MPLDESHPQAVVFIVAPQLSDEGLVRNEPLGTGFLVSVPSETHPAWSFRYVVTAKHVLPGDRSNLCVRFNTSDGDIRDIDAPDWFDHDLEDVSVAFLVTPRDVTALDVPETMFLDAVEVTPPLLGDTVFFVGLLGWVKPMARQNVPMVRSGTLGAKYQDGVPIELPDGTTTEVTAHLIDCRSYRGFSGSPCFIQWMPETATSIDRTTRHTALLGVVSAHFNMTDEVPLPGDLVLNEGDALTVPVHAGVGVVVPVEHIRHLLNCEALNDMRETVTKQLLESGWHPGSHSG